MFPACSRMALDSRLCRSDEPQAGKPPELERYRVTNQGLSAVALGGVMGLSGVGAILRLVQNVKLRKAGRSDH